MRNVKDNYKKYKNFLEYKNNAIDYENGVGFHQNINKNCSSFYRNYDFILFKIYNVDDINACYIHYIYSENEQDIRNCWLTLINFCIAKNVKFIYYSEKDKKKNLPYYKLFDEYSFKKSVRKKKYKYDFKNCPNCKKDSVDGMCECDTKVFYI